MTRITQRDPLPVRGAARLMAGLLCAGLLVACGEGVGDGSPSPGGEAGAPAPAGRPGAARPLSPHEMEILQQSAEAGVAALKAGRHAQAALELSKAVGVQPDNPQLLRMLGNAHAHNNDLDLAKRTLEASIRIDPTIPGTHYELAQVALARGELDLAAQAARQTTVLDPGSPRAKELLGVILYRRGEVEPAMALLEPVVSADASRLDALQTMGLCYLAVERYEDARDTFRSVVARDPTHAEGWFNLGKVLAILGDETGAEEASARFLQLRPDGVPPAGAEADAAGPPGVGGPAS